MYTIYKIINNINKDFYIGFTTKSHTCRFREHCQSSNSKKNNHFHHAIIKYGKENFTIEVLEMGENIEYGKNVAERMYIEWLKPQYNKTLGGDGVLGQFGSRNGFYGKRHTEETRKVLRQKCTGRKHTPEEIEKQIKAQTGKKKPSLWGRPSWNAGKTGLQVAWNKGKTYSLGPPAQVTCPHCQKIGGINTMKRWHFDKCRKVSGGVI